MKQPQAKVSPISGEPNALAAKCEQFALEMQCLPSLAVKARSLRACVPELEEWSKVKASYI